MRIFGYKDEGLPPEEIRPVELAEIILTATPAELRKIAEFMNSCADDMEARGLNWEHEHLSDKQKGFDGSPHFVVFNPQVG